MELSKSPRGVDQWRRGHAAISESSSSDEGSTGEHGKRLARNRHTARERRRRKKEAAQTLSGEAQALRSELSTLLSIFESLPADSRGAIAPSVMAEEPELVQQDELSDAPPPPPSVESASLDPEERRRRRLERNAASARACRARKKIYVANLQTEIAVLKRKVDAVRACIPASRLGDLNVLRALPHFRGTELSSQTVRLSGWEGARRRHDAERLPVAKRMRVSVGANVSEELVRSSPAVASRASKDPEIVCAAVTLFEVAQLLSVAKA